MTQTATRVLAILALSIICHSEAHAQWSQTPGPFGGAVFFLEHYSGAYWAGSEAGLYRSADGQQWSRVENLGIEPVVAGLADQDTMYLVRGLLRCDLLTSTDGGQTWKVTEIDETPPTTHVVLKKAAGALIIGAVTPSNYYLRSKDNGATIGFLPGGGVILPDFLDANGGLIVKGGSSANLQISQNGGNTFFSRMIAPGFNTNYQVVVLDSAIVTRVQSNGGALSVKISFDTAQNWQTLNLPPGFDPDAVTLKRSGKKGLLALIFGQYAWTTDYGVTWKVFTSPEVPWGIHENGNEWLLFSENGMYKSASFGADWTDASAGFAGQVVYRVQAGGDKLYALDVAPISSDRTMYVRENENTGWTKSGAFVYSTALELAVQGPDTLVTYDQISLDGGQTWTYISYPGVSSFAPGGIDIHDNQAFVSLNQNVYKVPLTENPTATVMYGPSVTDNVYNTLFVGDSLYAATTTGHIFLQLPNTTDWIPLTSGGPGYGGELFRVNGRFFLPRWTDIRYSDDGINFQTLPVTGLNSSPTEITVIHDMIGVGNVIVAATDLGLFFSSDKGEHWWPFQTGLPENDYLPSLDLTLNNGVLYAAMLRQGIWQRSVATGSSSGLVYRDDNQNGQQEPGELPLPNIKVVSVLSDQLALTDSLGRYDLVFDLAADTVRTIPPVAYASVVPAYRLASGISSDQDFGIGFQANITDVRISATNTAAMRPGFENSLSLRVSNVGTTNATTAVSLKLPADIEYLGANPAPDFIIGDSLIWNTVEIPFAGHTDISVQVRVAATTALGSILSFHTYATPENTDSNLADNTFELAATVVGAYDPNDKQVWPGDHITPNEVAAGVPLRYTIRFQNTGNYTAERVRLIDTLDAGLDLATLSVLGASHPFTWQVKDGHVLEIVFDQIQLPDSISDPAGSHGFFSFSIAAKRTLPLGTPLHNQAAIYFDYNSPVLTNTTFTQVSFESAVSNPADPALRLHIFPNPMRSKCTIQAPASGGRMALYDASGKLLKAWVLCPEQMGIQLQEYSPGTYYFRWEKGTAFVVEKAVVLGH